MGTAELKISRSHLEISPLYFLISYRNSKCNKGTESMKNHDRLCP